MRTTLRKNNSKDAKKLVVAMTNERCFSKTLDKLAAHLIEREATDTKSKMKFGVSCNGDDNPVLKAGILLSDGSFNKFTLACIRKRGVLIAGERSIALWKLSELYRRSPIVFKDDSGMTLEEYAFWMRKPVVEVEKIFCQEIIGELMKYVKHDPLWRIWQGTDWIEIDPWNFAIDVDLEG